MLCAMTGASRHVLPSTDPRVAVLDAAVVETTMRLTAANTAQEIADAVGEVVRAAAGWFGVVLGLVDSSEAVLQQYWCAPLRDTISARYVRVPVALDTPQTRAVRTKVPVFIADAAMLQAEFPGPFRQARTEGLGPCAALPLVAGDGEVLGALAFMWMEGVYFGPEERGFAEVLGSVASRAVARVQAAARERSVADTLQAAFLSLDVHPGSVVVDAVYHSADSALQIGGDWYDAIERADGRFVVTDGDTVGNSLRATATMGRLRSSCGVSALQTADPARVLQSVDDYAGHVPGATSATMAIAVCEPARQRVRYVSAGHPPPALVRPDGSVELLWGARSWPLDLDVGEARPAAATARFPPGSLLLLYTDGLVERRGETLDEGFARLVQALRRHWTLPVRRLLERVVADCGVDARVAHDDTALIAVRSLGASDAHFIDVVPAERAQLTEARHRLQRWLERLDLTSERAADVALAANEVIANALEHGSDFDPANVVSVEAGVAAGTLTMCVRDTGRWRPGVEEERTDRGRGLLLVEELTDGVHIDEETSGTRVILAWTLAGSSPVATVQ